MQDPHSPEGEDDDELDADDDGETSASPRDFVLSGVGEGAPPPMIVDPVDGLPRPKDEGFVQNAVPAATDENLVCQEGGTWKVYEGRKPDTEQPDEAKLRLVKALSYENGNLRLYSDPSETSSLPTYWTRKRSACAHYAELETMVTEFVLEGHDKAPQTILRKCMKLDLVLTDGVIRGCSLRSPRDIVSEQRLIDRAREKAQQAKEGAIGMFRDARPEELAPAVDPAKATARSFADQVFDKATGKRLGGVFGYLPAEDPTIVVGLDPLYVFFPDEAWQPRDDVYHGLRYKSRVAHKPRVWSASLSGELLIRQSPGIANDERVADLTGIRKMQWQGHVRAIAKALVEGRNVAVVAYHQDTAASLRFALFTEIENLGGTLDSGAYPEQTTPKKKAAPKKAAAKKTPPKKTKKTR